MSKRGEVVHHMMLLLVEDEAHLRHEFKEYIEVLTPTLGYPVSFYMADGESEALSLVQKFSFDAIILDLEFHDSNGDGFSFLKKIKQLKLPDKPYIVVSTFNRSPLVRESVRESGADYVFSKTKTDYSPRLVMEHICIIYDHKIKKQSKASVKVKKLSLEDEIRLRVNKIGFTDDLRGKQYVIDAVLVVAKSKDPNINLKTIVYPVIARKHNKTVNSINRAIETSINKAWSIEGDDTWKEFYSASYSGTKGAPTPKEFIFTLASEIKETGKA